LDCSQGRNRDFNLEASIGFRNTRFGELGDSPAPFVVGGDLAGQGVVERPAGSAYVADEILPLRVSGVESESERSELHGFGHGHYPVCWPLVAWVGTL
jgi:hypothetical protein